jgi:hypothetical protein
LSGAQAAVAALLRIEEENHLRRDFATNSCGDKLSLSGNNRNATSEDGRLARSTM